MKYLKYFGKKAIKDTLKLDKFDALRKNTFAVDSRDNSLQFWYNRVMVDPSAENYEGLNKEIAHRMHVDDLFTKMFPQHMSGIKDGKYLPTDWECYRSMIATYEEQCEPISDYTLKYLKAFVAECEATKAYPEFQAKSIEKIGTVCKQATQ